MNVPIFYFKEASLGFSNKILFNKINMQIIAGDKIALVGRNGSGKSSLMKTIAGIYELDNGEVFYNAKSIGYLPQNEIFDSQQTVYDYVLQAIPLQDDETLDQKRYLADMILDKMELLGNWQLGKLSGGKVRRTILAKALINPTDLLLLDEPTNHLDIVIIEWLEDFLKNYLGGLVLISHDRAFLSAVTNKICWLDRGQLYSNNNGYANFEQWSTTVLEQEIQRIEKLNKELEKENLWLAQGVTARRKRNQQRLGSLFALRARLRSEKTRMNKATIGIKLPDLPPSQLSKMVIEMRNVSYEYHNNGISTKILKDFSMRIIRKEVIGIIGGNGTGKTSFLKLIIKELQPDTGSVKLGHTVEVAYSDQHRTILPKDKTLWQIMCPNGGDTVMINGTPRHVIGYLKDFMFDPKQAKCHVDSLSGGELNRLLLAKILLNPGSLLILDEPTNDLDMDSLDMLQEVLSDYQGTIIVVSHDRDFLDKIATRILHFSGNGKVEDYIGGYSDFVEQTKNLKTAKAKVVERKNNQIDQSKTNNENNKKLSYKFMRELELLPLEIEQITEQISHLEQELELNTNLFSQDSSLFYELSTKLSTLKELLEQKENRWLELEELKSQLN